MTNENPLLISTVPRNLETKSKLFGFELADVLVLFLNLSIQNLLFGQTPLKIPLVWGTTLTIGLVLFFVKRGKPENYLGHLLQYHFSPTVRFAGLNDRHYRKFSSFKNGGSNESL